MPTVETENVRTTSGDIRSIPDLFRKLRDETTTLFRQEVALAKAEMSDKVSRVSRNAIYVGVGAMVAYAGFLFLLLALSHLILIGLGRLGLSPAIAVWIAPAIVGVVFAAIGYGFLQTAISTFKRESIAPRKTMQSLQENKEWIKEKIQ